MFRAVCAYLVVYNLPFPLNILPQGFPPYDNFWNALAVWVGRHVFHRTVDISPSGSGDTTTAWVQVFCCLVIALSATIFWTLLDRKRPHYDRLYDWLRVYIRFALATTMISYGADKLIPTQFPPPSPTRLIEPFGDASPMGLLWTFMGTSPAYQMFGGLIEMLGALLLTTRHTTLLGALLLVGVLSNVVALNVCYDVPVKLYSANLLLMAVFLAAPSASRLIDLFVRGRAVGATPLRRLFQGRRLNQAALIVRTVFVVGIAGMALYQSEQSRTLYNAATRSPFYGLWTVDRWEVNDTPHTPAITDTILWRRIIFSGPMWLSAETVAGTKQHYRLRLNLAARTLQLKSTDDSMQSFSLTYTQPGPDLLTLAGTVEGQRIQLRLHHETARDFLLMRRGFHWINEFPYNR